MACEGYLKKLKELKSTNAENNQVLCILLTYQTYTITQHAK